MPEPDSANLIWIDLEMTGLDPSTDQIIEVATIITDSALTPLAEGPVLAIHQSGEVLQAMDDWNQHHHGVSGLIDRVAASRLSVGDAERQTLDFLAQWVPAGASPMCGNSICQDRRFLARLMPDLEAWFHYRNLDVSTLKELVKRWSPTTLQQFQKRGTHQALEDIRESIAELQFYRKTVLTI